MVPASDSAAVELQKFFVLLVLQAQSENLETAQEAASAISRINMELAMFVTARFLGLASSWMMTRTVRRQLAPPIGRLMGAAVRIASAC